MSITQKRKVLFRKRRKIPLSFIDHKKSVVVQEVSILPLKHWKTLTCHLIFNQLRSQSRLCARVLYWENFSSVRISRRLFDVMTLPISMFFTVRERSRQMEAGVWWCGIESLSIQGFLLHPLCSHFIFMLFFLSPLDCCLSAENSFHPCFHLAFHHTDWLMLIWFPFVKLRKILLQLTVRCFNVN